MSDSQLLRDVLTEDPLLLTAVDAARVLGISRSTLYTLIRDGAIKPVHIGRSCRLSRGELHRFVQTLEAAS